MTLWSWMLAPAPAFSRSLRSKPAPRRCVADVPCRRCLAPAFTAAAFCRPHQVYAVEASSMAHHARRLMKANGLEGAYSAGGCAGREWWRCAHPCPSADKVIILEGRVEEVDVPEKVDIIISEPIGFVLVHERMLECYVAARNRFLKPGGLMMPTTGTIFVAPFTDAALYEETAAKVCV